jgi:hypothetical protein
MSKSQWSIEIQDSSGTYVNDGYIYAPNIDIEEKIISTQQKVLLANSSKAFIGFEYKSQFEAIDFFWADCDAAFISQLETYIGNNDNLRITSSEGTIFQGHFITYQKTWIVGTDPVEYDIVASFERDS